MHWLCFYKRPITPLNWIDAVFRKILSGHQLLITDGRTDRGNINAPPPFFEWRGHKNITDFILTSTLRFAKCIRQTVSQRKSKLRCQSIDFGSIETPTSIVHVFNSITSQTRTMLNSDWLGHWVGHPLKFNTQLFTSPLF